MKFANGPFRRSSGDPSATRKCSSQIFDDSSLWENWKNLVCGKLWKELKWTTASFSKFRERRLLHAWIFRPQIFMQERNFYRSFISGSWIPIWRHFWKACSPSQNLARIVTACFSFAKPIGAGCRRRPWNNWRKPVLIAFPRAKPKGLFRPINLLVTHSSVSYRSAVVPALL